MLRSSIDLGTNTCLLLIAETNNSGSNVIRIVEDHSTIIRLGQGVDQARTLHPDAIERAMICLRQYAQSVVSAGLRTTDTICVATSQARDAQNGIEFFERVKQETGFNFAIISGEQEAQMTFKGALLPDMNPSHCAVIDIGGGSTEYMALSGGKSLDVGSVRFTERYLKSNPVKDSEFWACQQAIDDQLSSLSPWREQLPGEIQLVGVAGTVTTLASWFLGLERFDALKMDGTLLSSGDIHRMVEELKWRTIEERQSLTGIEKARADVLLAGALILWRSMEVLHFRHVAVSTRGLRFGALLTKQ